MHLGWTQPYGNGNDNVRSILFFPMTLCPRVPICSSPYDRLEVAFHPMEG